MNRSRKLIPCLLLCLLHSALTAHAQECKPLRVVCFGDSITGPKPRQAYLDQYVKWSDLLQLLIEGQSGARKVEVLNRGWAGDTVAAQPHSDGVHPPGAVTRHRGDILDEKPDIAVILLSGNDAAVVIKNDRSLTETARHQVHDGLTRIVADCKAAGIRVLLLQYPEPHAADMSAVWRHLDQFNGEIAQVAAEQNVPTLELAPAFHEAEKTHRLEELRSPKDGVHLNPCGEIVLARAVFHKLQKLGWLKPVAE